MLAGLSQATTHLSPLEAAARYLDRQQDDATIAVALSGGGDSVGLLVACCEAPSFRSGRVRLAAITVDHGLRVESAAEAAAMADLSRRLSIPHLTMAWREDKPKTGLSAAARKARYRLLAAGAAELGADCLVTAHTLDDQLETVEMRRQRSETSLRGLAGIAPAALFFGTLAVHRPFLEVRRSDIRAYLHERQIGWIDDPSNENPDYERVRVRQSGQFALDARAITDAGRERRGLSEAAAGYIVAHVRMPLPLLFALDLPERVDGAFRLALGSLIAMAGGQTHLPGQEQLDRLCVALLAADARGAVSLGRTVVERRKTTLYVSRDTRNLPSAPSEPFPPGDHLVWDGRFRVRAGDGHATGAEASGEVPIDGAVPSGVARRALATLPAAGRIGTGAVPISSQPFLAPFETVLSSFDIALADAICGLTGRPLFPRFVMGGLETSARNG